MSIAMRSGRFDLQVRQGSDGDGTSFFSEAGFRMLKGPCEIVTDRGRSRPSARMKLGIEHRVRTKALGRRAVEFRQELRNISSQPLHVREIVSWDGMLELDGRGWRLFHAELFKGERFFGGYSFVTDGFFSSMPESEGTFGLSEDTPFPGIFFTHPERGTVLIATLSQERCRPSWVLRRRGLASELTMRETFDGVPSIPIPPGGAFEGEQWVVLSVPGDVNEAMDEYFRLLRRRMEFPGATSIMREAVIWGSWNLNMRPGGFGDITHDYIAANARALRKLAPGRPRFVMIDDGYQRGSSAKTGAGWYSSGMDFFFNDGLPAHDAVRFPRGMKGMADAIRRAGDEPAIWISPRLDRDLPLARTHPEWLMRPGAGRKMPGRMEFLDYSLPEVREFTRSAWHTITREWGYKGIKLDFWTTPFETPGIRFRNRDRTSIELRNLFLSDLREFVPPDGYIITCCTVNAGNPFLGRYADSSRCGDDLSDGCWAKILDCATWLTASSLFYRDDALLADPDSIGYSHKSTEEENRLWATTALFGGAVCEIAGDLTHPAPEAARLLSTAIAFSRPRLRFRHDALGPGIQGVPAMHWSAERSDGLWEAWVNPTSWPRLVRLPRPRRELWTGEMMSGDCRIPPHGARVFRR